MTALFHTVLIANRGEIACRIIRTLRKLGIKSVAVFSDADRNALHTRLADQAIHIGPAPSRESYLDIDKIISAAKISGANAIHPGYGFLSENPMLALACIENGITFIGPTAEAIQAMGSKSEAKKLMEKAGVPLIPGYHGEEQDETFLKQQADKIGYPIILKAALGGGGKGMRIVRDSTEFAAALASCQREALASFNNDTILIEKYIQNPRHIEVQVFADNHGNIVHLYERDCSIQRRHQKIVEEAPASNIPETIRENLYRDAIAAAQAINYTGAGTVEFLYDGDQSYYFMEMNTRLQVEHPVTELITGVDLVEWQIRVAEGACLPKQQHEINLIGHAIEVRICAENPHQDFIPSTGEIEILRSPAQSHHIRLDSGLQQKDAISIYYDPMIAKLIAWDNTREQANRQLDHALTAFEITGVDTNIAYLRQILQHPSFVENSFSTNFIETHSDDLIRSNAINDTHIIAAALAELIQLQNKSSQDPWASSQGWKSNASSNVHFEYKIGNHIERIDIATMPGKFEAECKKRKWNVSAHLDDNTIHISNDINTSFGVKISPHHVHIFDQATKFDIAIYHPDAEHSHDSAKHRLSAPMPGIVTKILVAEGDEVSTGQALIVMEAMKMEHIIRADQNAKVVAILCTEGSNVQANKNLIDLGE